MVAILLPLWSGLCHKTMQGLLLQGQAGPRMHNLSPEPVAHLSQHKLLPLLLHRAQAAAGPDSIRFGHQLQDFQQTANGIHCRIQPRQVRLDLA